MTDNSNQVFLSHNSADNPFVEFIAEALERAQLKPWLDIWHSTPGEAWQPAIEQALRACRCCVVFVGPSGLGAWQNEEMRAAINRRVTTARAGEPFRVIPVLLPGAVRGYRSDLPDFLTATTWVEFRTTDDATALRTLERAVRGLPPREELAAANVECPYRGLEAFSVNDADLFFGREAVTDWLLSVLRGTQSPVGPSRFLAIVGASGSGKSSLARAGVMAALKRGEIDGSQDWLFTICKPGARPLESLAGALDATEGVKLGDGLSSNLIRQLIEALRGHADTLHLTGQASLGAGHEAQRHLVLIDQFEEVFTQCQDATERDAFIDNLLHASRVAGGRTIVLLTMRADFFESCAVHAALRTTMSDHTFLLGPLSDDELRSAIERPTLMCRGTIEPGLTELLLKDMVNQEQALPLLQHALRQLWQTTTNLRLTVNAYQALGGLQGALDKHASAVYEGLAADQRLICRDVMLALVNVAAPSRETRRRTSLDDLATQIDRAGDARGVIRLLADARLIVTSASPSTRSDIAPFEVGTDATVELIHEALIRGWSKLRAWIEEARLDAATPRGKAKKRLAELADAYDRSPQPRNLPSLFEYVAIRRHTSVRAWTGGQRRMMRKATAWHGFRVGGLLLTLFAGVAYYLNYKEIQRRELARELVGKILAFNSGINTIKYDIQRLRDEPGLKRGATGVLNEIIQQENTSEDAYNGTRTAQLLLLTMGDRYADLFNELGTETRLEPESFQAFCWTFAARASKDTAMNLSTSLKAEATGWHHAVKNQSEYDEKLRAQIRHGQLRAALVSALLRHGEATKALTLFQTTDDPETMTQFCAHFKECGVTARHLHQALLEVAARNAVSASDGTNDGLQLPSPRTNPTSQLANLQRFTLLMALGEYKLSELPPEMQASLSNTITEWFKTDRSSAIHGVTGWLLRRWGHDREADDIERNVAEDTVPRSPDKEWFVVKVNSDQSEAAYFTFVVFEPGRFEMGSPQFEHFREKEKESAHQVQLKYKFAICDREVTNRHFAHFRRLRANDQNDQNDQSTTVTWQDGVEYCNWLTDHVFGGDVDKCYVLDGTTLVPQTRFLKRRGFRMATDAEMEYATRCGTRTPYGFGSDRTLIRRYGSPDLDSPDRSAGDLGARPNLRGVFDLHGNTMEWCSDRWVANISTRIFDPFVFQGMVDKDNGRVIRGGEWRRLGDARSASRHWQSQTPDHFYGIRLVLTLDSVAGAVEK